MIASITSSCYTNLMKKKVVLCCGILALMSLAARVNLFDEIVMFVLVGHVPFTSFVISPTAMLLFWATIIPATYLCRHILARFFWSAVEALGKVNQRRINIEWRHHLRSLKINPTNLYLITLLYVADQLPESSTDNPDLYFRRRFMVLPA